MITKTSEWYWLAYHLSSRSCKLVGCEIDPYTQEKIFEIEV